MVAKDDLIRTALHAIGHSFYGGCVANLGGAPMRKGHNNQGRSFDVETACYLKPIFAAYDNPHVRKIVIKAGVKTVKSFAAEVMAAHFVCHGNGDVALYFGSGDVADDQSTTRIIDYYEGIPSFQEKLKTIADRFDKTNGSIKFPDKTLRILPANLANTQGLNLGCMVVCDAFVTERNGMINQAIARTTQYPDSKKIILESQGGELGFDFDNHYDDTNQQELYVICPYCLTPQIWNWKAWTRKREDGFIAVLPNGCAKTVEELTAELLTEDRRNCGFMRGPNATFENGTYNEQAILRETYFECYSCGSPWKDDRNTREVLDRSSHYIAARLDALPANVGFNCPQWINRRLPWGEIMLDYLKCKRIEDEFGNKDPIKLWWQKSAARTWDDRMLFGNIAPIIGTAKFEGTIPNEAFRSGQVDCQKAIKESQRLGREVTGNFWATADAVDRAGNRFELWRGYCRSWDEWVKKFQELKIPTRNIAIDGGHWFDDVKEQAARHRTIESGTDSNGNPCKVWATWKVLRGSDIRSFRWEDGQWRAYRIVNERVNLLDEKTGKWSSVTVPVVEWSNFAVKNQLHLSLLGMPGKPKMTGCPESQLSLVTVAREAEKDFSYESQLNSEVLGEYRGRPKWLPIHKQNHYRDCKCMGIVLAMMKGLVGAIAPPGEQAQKAG